MGRACKQHILCAAKQQASAVNVASMVATEGHSTILVLDYGSQYTQLITRRVREVGLFSLLFPGDASLVSSLPPSACSLQGTCSSQPAP